MGIKGKLLGIILSVIFLGLALYTVNLDELRKALASANYLFVLPAVLITLTGYILRTLRWKLILDPTKRIPVRRLFPVLMIGFMMNNVLPARLGEFARAYTLGNRENISRTLSLTTILLERVLDGITLLLFLGVVSVLLPPPPGTDYQRVQYIQMVALAIFAIAAGGIVLLLVRESWFWAIARFFTHRLPGRFGTRIEALLQSFVMGLHALRSPRRLLGIAIVSILVWSCEAFSYLLIMEGFNLGLTPFAFASAAIFLLVIVNLGIMVPSGPGYVGTFEAFGKLALLPFGVSTAVATAIPVVSHVAQWLLVTGIGIAFVSAGHMSLRRLEEASQRTAESEETPKAAIG